MSYIASIFIGTILIVLWSCFLYCIHKHKKWWFGLMDKIQMRFKFYPDCSFCWGVHLGVLIPIVYGLITYIFFI